MKSIQNNESLKELWKVRNPSSDSSSTQAMDSWIAVRKKQKTGLSHEEMIELATSRNRNVITKEEQSILRHTNVAFFGLSVGSNAVFSWTMLARPDSLIVADPDYISSSNLNRIKAPWSAVGMQKVDWIRKSIHEISPHTNIKSYTNTNDLKKIQSICFDKNARINVIVDEIDDIDAKICLRRIAQKSQIPLISAIDVGDNVFLDLERYDTEKPQPFLGRISEAQLKNIASFGPREKRSLIFKIVGMEHNSERMLYSIMSIGKTISTWPQLGSTASIAGGLVATTIKKIRLGEKVKSGRYYIDLDSLLDSSFLGKKRVILRSKLKKQISDTLL